MVANSFVWTQDATRCTDWPSSSECAKRRFRATKACLDVAGNDIQWPWGIPDKGKLWLLIGQFIALSMHTGDLTSERLIRRFTSLSYPDRGASRKEQCRDVAAISDGYTHSLMAVSALSLTGSRQDQANAGCLLRWVSANATRRARQGDL